jgi:hypothetical protein
MPLRYNINYLVYVCVPLDCHRILRHYVYGSKTVKVFALYYRLEDAISKLSKMAGQVEFTIIREAIKYDRLELQERIDL